MIKFKAFFYLLSFLGLIYLVSGANLIEPEHNKKFQSIFEIELPKESSRVVYIRYGVLDVPRFEFKLSSEFFPSVVAASKLAGYPEWVTHKYERNEPVSVLERYLYGYARGDSNFYTTEKKVSGNRKVLIFDPDYQYFIAIKYIN